MDLVGTVINAVVIGVVGLILGWIVTGRLKALERRIDRLEERMDTRADGLQAQMTQIALAVGARPRAENA